MRRDESKNGKWKVGDVIRRTQINRDNELVQPQPFSDTIILSFDDESELGSGGEAQVKVARPYAYANIITGTVLTGVETYSFPQHHLEYTHYETTVPIWKLVDRGRTT